MATTKVDGSSVIIQSGTMKQAINPGVLYLQGEVLLDSHHFNSLIFKNNFRHKEEL